jgi:putative transposase
MPWKETCAMDERIRFIGDWLSGIYSKTVLCEMYGISRPTGDKWIGRFAREGADGLKERSRAPYTHPGAVSGVVWEMIIETKLRYQDWGPKKVLD